MAARKTKSFFDVDNLVFAGDSPVSILAFAPPRTFSEGKRDMHLTTLWLVSSAQEGSLALFSRGHNVVAVVSGVSYLRKKDSQLGLAQGIRETFLKLSALCVMHADGSEESYKIIPRGNKIGFEPMSVVNG